MALTAPEAPLPPAGAVLPRDFYGRGVVEVARELVGCRLEHGETMGVIVETEAYHEDEPACHAFVGLTPRTSTLFRAPGHAYIYLSYGIHSMFNAVCEPEGVGAAVLIRALEPVSGVELMRVRRGVNELDQLCSGPGKLTQALGLELALNGSDLSDGPIRIYEREKPWRATIVSGRRIGITKAAELPWRFAVRGNRHVSRPKPL